MTESLRTNGTVLLLDTVKLHDTIVLSRLLIFFIHFIFVISPGGGNKGKEVVDTQSGPPIYWQGF